MSANWHCLTCDAHGETTGTEASADAKHAKTEGHVTTTHAAEWACAPCSASVGRSIVCVLTGGHERTTPPTTNSPDGAYTTALYEEGL